MPGPASDTPLAQFFYAGYLRSGRTYEQLAKATGMKAPTIAAYINGSRGAGGQSRTISKIRTIARALDLDEEEALRLARLSPDESVVRAILDDPRLPRAVREAALRAYETELRKPPQS